MEQKPWKEGTKPWYEKGYAAWDWVTGSREVCVVPCELVYALLSASGTATVTLYDGISATGNVVAILQAAAAGVEPLSPPEPIICFRGLYLENVADNLNGVLILWRPLPTGWRP